jgi:hypothetical protein
MFGDSLIRSLRPVDNGDYQENEDSDYVDVLEGDNNEGKS